MKQPRTLKSLFEILLVIGIILLIPLFFAVRSQAAPQAAQATPTVVLWPSATPLGSIIRNSVVAPAATALPNEVAMGKEPPACTFPLAQTTTTKTASENYTFSEPKVVLTASVNIDIVEWLPDNRRILIMRDIPAENQQSIELFDFQSRSAQVYAIRTTTIDAPPSWVPQLNTIVYPTMNILGDDKINHRSDFTRQVWFSQGNPKDAQLVADNMSQFYVAVKPGGSQITYLVDKQLSKRNASVASLPPLPSQPLDLTQWAVPRASFQAAWRPGTSQVFLYNTSYVPSIPGYTFLLDVDSGQICNIDLGSSVNGHAWAGVGRWSQNGRYLATVRASGTLPLTYSDLAVLDTATGKLYTMDITSQETQGSHFVKDIAWAPDNRHLLVIAGSFSSSGSNPNNGENKNSGLYLVDLISGKNVHLLPTYQFSPGWWGTNMAWSPDGSKLLASCPRGDGEQLCLLNVQKSVQP